MDTFVVSIAKEGLFLVLILSAPPVLAALCVGLFVSIMQATTQVQEQTLTFVPKLVAIILVLIVLGPLGVVQIMQYTTFLLDSFSKYIR
jgi:flagellar biosynthetic protein FliQ